MPEDPHVTGERPHVDHLGVPLNEAARELAETGHDPSVHQPTELERIAGWFDERTGTSHIVRVVLRKVFPDHWSFLLGELALFCFVILFATGIFLTFFYVPSGAIVTYQGTYEPLKGQEVSAAFDSVMRLSMEVRAGLLMRQIHHWTAVIFVAVIVLHLARIFFTGAFRRPRELNWLIGFTLLALALAEGITGYSLPDDLLSGTGARIIYSAAMAIPFIGPYVAFLVFGGEFPTIAFISRFFVIHIFLLPLVFAGGIALHVGLVFLQKHTQFRGRLERDDNVVGRVFWPSQAFVSTGLFFLTAAVLAGIGGLVQINPIWSYGPFEPSVVSSPSQPDWYVGWLDGALRIFPPFEPTILGVTIPDAFIPGILIPGIVFTIVAIWPWIDRLLTGDRAEHHLLDWPWERPVRAASGAAILTFFALLTLAGGNDVLSVFLDLSVEAVTRIFQVLVLVGPVAAFVITYLLAKGRLGEPPPEVLEEIEREHPEQSPRAGIALRRTEDGGFEEVEA